MRRCLLLCSLVIGVTLGQTSSGEYTNSLSRVYGTVLTAKIFAELFTEKRPADAAANQSAYEAWLASYRLQGIEQHARNTFGDRYAVIEQRVDKNLATMRGLVGLSMKLIPTYADFLKKNETFYLDRKMPRDLEAVQERLAGSTSPSAELAEGRKGSPEATSSPATQIGGGGVYTVEELNSLTGKIMHTAGGHRGEKKRAALAELQRRGPRLTMLGVVGKRGRSLEYEDDTFRGRFIVYLYDFLNENQEDAFRKMIGRTVAVNCNIRDVDTWIEANRCRLAPEATAAATSGIEFFPGGFQRKRIPRESLVVPPGSGLKPSEVDAVYLVPEQQTGVGGYFYTVYNPALVLRNGLYYDEPFLAPDSFNAVLSQQKEPQNWGKLVVSGSNGTVTWLESPSADGDPERKLSQLFRALPGKPELRLSGTYSHLTGGGNTAFGGNTIVHSTTSFTFQPDGRFKTDRFVGASSGGDYNPSDSTRVTAWSKRGPESGSYSIDGWAIELNYDSGKRERLLFCGQDTSYKYICIGDTMYLNRAK